MSQQDENAIIGRLDRVEKKLDLVLYGTPEKPERGVIVRLDRLEQADASRRWTLRTLVGAVLALLANWFHSMLTRP